MTLLGFANLFNATGLGLVLLISWIVAARYRNAMFQEWLRAYAAIFVGVCLDLATAIDVGPATLVLFLRMLAALTSAWFFFRTANTLKGQRMLGPSVYAGGVALLAALWVVHTLFRTPPMSVLGPVVVLLSLSELFLGIVLLQLPGTQKNRNTRWLGWPLIAMSLWVFTYPMFDGTQIFWFGYWVSSLFNLLIGLGMVVFLLDEFAQELQLNNVKLIQLNEVKTNFLSTVSHELRTPLASIQGYMELIDDGLAGPVTDEQHDFFRQMKRASGQLKNLIDSLLDSVQLDAGELMIACEALDLKQLLLKNVDVVRPLLNAKGLQLAMSLPDGLPQVTADEQRVEQVMNNLLSNAIKFTAEGGQIRVELRQCGDFLEVRVVDDGIGIPPDKLDIIFEPFIQVDSSLTRRYGGTGLGLSITRRLVDAMGGSIALDSEPGEGTTVTFTLPVIPVAVAQPR